MWIVWNQSLLLWLYFLISLNILDYKNCKLHFGFLRSASTFWFINLKGPFNYQAGLRHMYPLTGNSIEEVFQTTFRGGAENPPWTKMFVNPTVIRNLACKQLPNTQTTNLFGRMWYMFNQMFPTAIGFYFTLSVFLPRGKIFCPMTLLFCHQHSTCVSFVPCITRGMIHPSLINAFYTT